MKNLFKFLSLGLVFLFIVTIAVLSTLDIRTYSEPPLLLPILNTFFACLIPLVVAYIAARSYILSGSTVILLYDENTVEACLKLFREGFKFE